MTDNDLVMLQSSLEVLIGVMTFIGLLIFGHDVWKMWRGK